MMDGVVIAYRLNKNYPTQKWQAKSTLPAADLKFSNGFCLIKHEYESPANQTEGENKGKTNKLTFYSLYMHLADYQTYVPDSTNQEKTVTISKDTNARDTANINHKLGELTSGSTVKVDTQQQPYKAKINGKFYKYYQGTVVSKAADSTASIAVGALVYLYANCFPAGTFSTAEKPRFPTYWKATITGKSKERMKVYRTEQACMSRTTPHDALLNEQQTVTFESGQVKSATINGKTHKIAPCQIANTATFAHNVRLDEGWMIVDESQVSWEKVEPTEFDNIVKLSEPLPISAGDPVGFMGIWESPENPIAAGTTKTKYQMHVELFTANDKTVLDQFLNNEAKLTSGKKYLKVPKGTQLYASNGHGNYVYVHESLFAARDYVVAESDCSQMKDTAGTIFYQLKQIRTGEAALGPVDLYYVKIEGNVKLVTQYDWKELGFSRLEETNDDADGYINPEKVPSDLFKDIFKRVDGINSRNGQGDGNLTGKEIKDALQQDKDLRNELYKMIAGHPSEWHSTTQNNIKKMYKTIKAENTEEEYKNATQFEIARFLKCEFVSQIDGLTQKLWHFHPITTIFTLSQEQKNISSSFCFPFSFRPTESYKDGARYFGANRSNGRKHAGCDLIAPIGTEVYAVDDGVVIQDMYRFYEHVNALEIQHSHFIVRYGEIKNITEGIKSGTKIKKGQLIGYVGRLDSGKSMLHFEMYSGEQTGSLTVRENKPFQRRSDLINPTDFLDGSVVNDN